MKNTRVAPSDFPVSESELQAYVDGQLPVGNRARIEAYLAAHPSESERLAAYRRQNIGLHALFDATSDDEDLNELPPEMLKAAQQLEQKIRKPDKGRARLRRIIIAGLMLAAVGVGWMAHDHIGIISDALGWAAEISERALSS